MRVLKMIVSLGLVVLIAAGTLAVFGLRALRALVQQSRLSRSVSSAAGQVAFQSLWVMLLLTAVSTLVVCIGAVLWGAAWMTGLVPIIDD